jgi:hypothetical protein
MKITLEINDNTIREAAQIVMKHHLDKAFLDRLIPIRFNYTDLTGLDVVYRFIRLMPELNLVIKPYTTINPWSSVIGHARGETIFVNTRKLSLPLWDRVENIFHESTHLCGFSHDGNRPTPFNLKTVPYLSANIFANYCREIYDNRAGTV